MLPALFIAQGVLAADADPAPGLVEMVTMANEPRHLNLLLRANGGKIVLVNPPVDARFTNNLNDGYSTDWRSRSKQLPQDIVFAFAGGRTAKVDRVVVNTQTQENVDKPERVSGEFEIAVSLVSSNAGFTNVALGELAKKAGRQMISFEPSAARFLRVRFRPTQVEPVQIAEIEAYEPDGKPSILKGQPVNIAAAGNGGAVVRFSDPTGDAAWLIDGTERGWHTDGGLKQTDLTFAFRGDQVAYVNRIVLERPSQHPPGTAAQYGKVYVSRKSPIEGFEEAGSLLADKDGRELSAEINRHARFVKIALTNNQGGSISLGEVKIYEGVTNGYKSVMDRADPAGADTTPAELTSDTEVEPNNSVEWANKLFIDARLRGQIRPLGDEDYFAIEIEKPKFSEVSIELRGRPYIRTSLTLSQEGKTIAQHDPTNAAGERATIKFPVSTGTYDIRVYEPPTSMLIVYDASSSMRNSMHDLRVAVDAYVDQLRPSVLVNFIRFDSKNEVLLPEFTSDQAKLKNIIGQKFNIGSGTAFYDAVNAGFELMTNVTGNRAMIVMTDGGDSASKTNYTQFWKLVEKHKIRLYTVGFGQEMDLLNDRVGSTPRRMMAHIALASNGRGFASDDSSELRNLYEAIGEETRQVSDYSLLAFWGDKPPSAQTVSSALKGKKGSGRGHSARNFFLGLLAFLLLALIIGIYLATRSSRSRKRARRRVPVRNVEPPPEEYSDPPPDVPPDTQ